MFLFVSSPVVSELADLILLIPTRRLDNNKVAHRVAPVDYRVAREGKRQSCLKNSRMIMLGSMIGLFIP